LLDKSKEKLEKQLSVCQRMSDLSSDAICILSQNSEVQHSNLTMEKLLGFDKYTNEVEMEIPIELKIGNEWSDFEKFVAKHGNASKKVSFSDMSFRVFEKEAVPINLHIERIQSSSKKWMDVICMEDITEVKSNKENLLKHQITKLPNQLQSIKDLPALYAKTHLEKNKIALVLMSLDNFVILRSILGHEQSIGILKKFSDHLEEATKDLEVSSYHTFDNLFLISMRNIDSVEEVKSLISKLQDKLGSFYKVEDSSLHVNLSAGISMYPDSGATRDLLDNAYRALVEAQKKGEGKIHTFEPVSSKKGYTEQDLHNDMKNSLDKGEFEVHYQPIVDAKTEKVVSAEALIRWIHPKYGIISPDNFIHLMERTGFIVHLGRFVLKSVLKQQKRWEIFGFNNINVAINVSMAEIATGSFVSNAIEEIKNHNLDPDCIKFEITEGMAMMDEKRTASYFHELKKAGFQLSLDDFGTGYTSFTYLKKFPADYLKIDKSLVDNIVNSKEDQRIVKAMIELGHTLGMKIIIEGIENRKMADMLSFFDSDYFQGYYFAKPLPVFEFQKLLR
jgi:polar amino acid transport system substrate-binding protein